MNQINATTTVLILLIVWNSALSYIFIRQQQFFKTFTKGASKNDLKTILRQISQSLKKISSTLLSHEKAIDEINTKAQTHYQKLGFIRFNPFSDTGGDQSFCLCLLDHHDNGVVITSLHSREQTRIYSKRIKVGVSQGIDFSKEERQALKQAQASN